MPRRISFSLAACVWGVLLVSTLGACGSSSTSQTSQSSTSRTKHHATTVAQASSTARAASTTRPASTATAPATDVPGQTGTAGSPGGDSGSGTGSSSTSPGRGVSTLPGWPRCNPDDLAVDEGETQGAAGSYYQEVFFTNYGDSPCTLKGFPGVSLADSSGRTIGVPATRDGSTPTLVTLGARAGEASFVIHTTADTTGGGCWPTSAKINVYAPGFTVMRHVDGAITVCGGEFEVSPVVTGRLDPSL